MSFGLTFEKLLIIAFIAVIVVGPQRLPEYAAKLAKLVRQFRAFVDGAKDRLRDEMGPEYDDVDWKKLDPRQYDPRRIIREALLDDEPAPVIAPARMAVPGRESAYAQRQRLQQGGGAAPYDSEAT